MNDQLKQRLVGAIVLVALAVIFLPMLLEGDKRSGIPMFGSNVPETPQPKVGMVDIPLDVPPQAPAEPVAVVESPVEQDGTPVVSEPQATAPVQPQAQTQAQPVVPVTTKPTEPVPVQAVKPAEIAPPAKPASSAEAWAVQVGSFSDSRNAIKLRDSLRGKGYPAFVEQVKLASGNSYRVRVGPMLTRGDAEAVQAKLASKVDLKGIVVHHP